MYYGITVMMGRGEKGMLGRFFANRKYRQETLTQLRSILWFYPADFKNLEREYPAINDVIQKNVGTEYNACQTAMLIAAAILGNIAEGLTGAEREAIYNQWRGYDPAALRQTAIDFIGGKKNTASPDLLPGTLLYSTAMMISHALLTDGKIEERNYDNFRSEVLGALQGKSQDERQKERLTDLFDEISPREELRFDETDLSEANIKFEPPLQLPELAGKEVKVRLMSTPTGIAMVESESGKQVVERRNLPQDVLEQVPKADWNGCTFVNVKSRFFDDIHSCIIAGADTEIYGNTRAFWWAFARTNVWNACLALNRIRMTPHALSAVHVAARAMFDTAVTECSSIDNMRDQIMPLRNTHFSVISKLIEGEKNEARKLGLMIAMALVLAVQSEDATLEAFAIKHLGHLLWQPGEEPLGLAGTV